MTRTNEVETRRDAGETKEGRDESHSGQTILRVEIPNSDLEGVLENIKAEDSEVERDRGEAESTGGILGVCSVIVQTFSVKEETCRT